MKKALAIAYPLEQSKSQALKLILHDPVVQKLAKLILHLNKYLNRILVKKTEQNLLVSA